MDFVQLEGISVKRLLLLDLFLQFGDYLIPTDVDGELGMC